MGPREQLHQLVEALPDEQVPRALVLLRGMSSEEAPPAIRLPCSLGIGDSGRSDISERVDELLADGFGR